MSARHFHMTDCAPKVRRSRPIDWRRVYDRAVVAYLVFYIAAWFSRGFWL